jgi:hypothetical protein
MNVAFFTKCGQFRDWLNNCWLLEKDSVQICVLLGFTQRSVVLLYRRFGKTYSWGTVSLSKKTLLRSAFFWDLRSVEWYFSTDVSAKTIAEELSASRKRLFRSAFFWDLRSVEWYFCTDVSAKPIAEELSASRKRLCWDLHSSGIYAALSGTSIQTFRQNL